MSEALPPPVVGILALQGAFREHGKVLRSLGVQVVEVRQPRHLEGLGAIVLPGGESTTMGKLLTDWDMMDPLRERILAGMPVYGSCAGLILLCDRIEDSDQPRIGALDAQVRRNGYGRQVDSFEADIDIPVLGPEPFPAVFIRAPVLTGVGEGVTVLARVGEQPVAVRQGSVLASSFHPELTSDARFHRYFLNMCTECGRTRP
ncbi:MAG: pyridoxal 5'-phosphate synthase glutaminase subunit PdxT [Desulfovibrio sp.]|nr:pyridoxal 5'-phosphate synthase glutaminase subunit PdxT [Desulfovibrio sp.]